MLNKNNNKNVENLDIRIQQLFSNCKNACDVELVQRQILNGNIESKTEPPYKSAKLLHSVPFLI